MSPPDVPFSLVCSDCDAGQGITRDEAESAGWINIEYAPDLPMANYMGLCPDCQAVAS